MNLNRKTFAYSFVLTVTLVLAILAYLVYLLPSLYLANMVRSNTEASQNFHEAYLEQRKFPVEAAPNLNASLIFTSSKDSNVVEILSAYGTASIELKNKDMLDLLTYVKESSFDDPDFKVDQRFSSKEYWKTIKEVIQNDFDISLKSSHYKFDESLHDSKLVKGDNYHLFIASVEDRKNVYTNSMGVTQEEGGIIVTYSPFSISKIDDIQEVVLRSLPMIILGLILFTSLASLYFTRMIVKPIQTVVKHTDQLRHNQLREMNRLDLHSNDEIESLAESIDDMYQELRQTYHRLIDKHQKQELFLRASSHQLKTPVAASLLLVESMIDGIGKFKDHDRYLPKVKEQIQSIQRLIDDLLMINRPLDAQKGDWVAVDELVVQVLDSYQFQKESSDKQVEKDLLSFQINTQGDYLSKLIDNLIANAFTHSPEGSKIEIQLRENYLKIVNSGQIDPNILESIFEPFVTTRNHLTSGGLGLYIANKYAQALDYRIEIRNIENQVETTLYFA